jgi:hypothetical protein
MGRHSTGKTPKQPLREIKLRHEEIMRRLICGESNTRICRALNFSQSRLSVIINSPLFKKELAKLEVKVNGKFVESAGDAEKKIEGLKPKAIEILENILTGKEPDVAPRLKRDVAKDILELSGMGKKGRDDEGMSDFARLVADGLKVAEARKMQKSISAGAGAGAGSEDNGGSGNKNIIDVKADPVEEATIIDAEVVEKDEPKNVGVSVDSG